MPNELDGAVAVDFPLWGEHPKTQWVAVNTPSDRIPSHGTDMLGQRFAYDLLQVDSRRGLHDHPAGTFCRLIFGVRARDCYAWGAEIHAPFDGEIVRASDGVGERRWIHPLRELVLVLKNAATFSPDRLPSVLGNHVIMQSGDIFGLRPLGARFGHGRGGPNRAPRRCARARRPHWQLDVTAPSLPVDGFARADDGQGGAVCVPGLRGVAGRQLGERREWGASQGGSDPLRSR